MRTDAIGEGTGGAMDRVLPVEAQKNKTGGNDDGACRGNRLGSRRIEDDGGRTSVRAERDVRLGRIEDEQE